MNFLPNQKPKGTMSPPLVTTAAQLRRDTRRGNLRHLALGVLLGVTATTIYRWETGRIALSTVAKWALLGVCSILEDRAAYAEMVRTSSAGKGLTRG